MYKEPTYSETIFNIFLARVLKEKEAIKNISNGKYSKVYNMIIYEDKDSRDREYQIGKYKKSNGFWDMLRF